MDENKRIAFEVTYEWHKLDSHGNTIWPTDVSIVMCDTLDEAVKEHKIWLDSTINEVKSHGWHARSREAGSCSIHAVYMVEDDTSLDDAWDELSDEQKEIINNSCVTFLGRDL